MALKEKDGEISWLKDMHLDQTKELESLKEADIAHKARLEQVVSIFNPSLQRK